MNRTDEYTKSDEVSVNIQKLKFAAKRAKSENLADDKMNLLLASTKEAIASLEFFTFTLSDRVFQMTKKGAGYQLSVDQNNRMIPVITGPYESVFLKLVTMI